MQQMYSPPLTYTNKIIIIFSVVLFFLAAISGVYGGSSFFSYLTLVPKDFLQGHVYQIVTYPFVQQGLLTVIFNCLIIWFIGGDLELSWGRFFYRKFLGLAVVTTGLCYLVVSFLIWGKAVGYPLLGLHPLSLSLLVAYAMVYSDRYLTFFLLFPMKAKYFCLLLCAIEMYGAIVSQYAESAWAHLFAMGFSYIYLRYLSNKSKGKPFFSSKGSKKPKKPHLRIVKNKTEDKPKYWH